ncbi:MAG: type IX secretion system sortase PorU [Bacteroidales bacterium]|nr:type IX secretion system sortase PorU [Bacteroidales bacterium]
MGKKFLIFVFALLIQLISFADEFEKDFRLNWTTVSEIQIDEETFLYELGFNDAQYSAEYSNYPIFVHTEPIYIKGDLQAQISKLVYIPLTEEEELRRDKNILIPQTPEVITRMTIQNKVPFARVSFLPFRTNPDNGKVEKLASFTVVIQSFPYSFDRLQTKRTYRNQSVLKTGNWYKIRLQSDGVYKITYQDLEAMGINPSNINPSKMGIFGNGGDMRAESNSVFRYDGLQENAIYFSGEDDGKFDPQDYILFYGDSPDQWIFKAKDKTFKHLKHPYNDYTYYFLTTDQGTGKRIQDTELSQDEAVSVVNEFNDLFFHELDEVNLIHTGRTWYGENFRSTARTKIVADFNFHDVVDNSEMKFVGDFAARSTVYTYFSLSYNGDTIFRRGLPAKATHLYTYASDLTMTKKVPAKGNPCTIKIDFDPKNVNTSEGWLNYVEVQARSYLTFKGQQFKFFDGESVAADQTAEFSISNASENTKIWDVTDLPNVTQVSTAVVGNKMNFKIHVDSLREFVAFNGSDFKQVEFVKQIANQNLHAVRNLDMVIIAPKIFLIEANELANLHREYDNMNVGVFAPEAIYNEFSSGSLDITALRDFFKMLYDDSDTGKELKYVLLFGDGTFDTKNRIENNNNFIPSYQSIASLSKTSSFVADDYYSILDDEEDSLADVPDIGIGRLTIRSESEARMMIKRIHDYMINSPKNMGDWRNKMCFVADDENGNVHLNYSEQLVDTVHMLDPNFIVNKIYLDAYPQESTPSGQRYPEARRLINDQINHGALCINYTGHGGELGWAHEQVLTLGDIGKMTNYDRLPLFITSTCEFSRFDNPEVFSAGEQLLLNPKGGAIALFTTTRLALSSINYAINDKIFKAMLCKNEEGLYPRLGDINKKSKNPNSISYVNIHLLGDPALRLKHPGYHVATTSINTTRDGVINDTLNALEAVSISGQITNSDGLLATDFNGVVYPKIFDKPSKITTLSNDQGSLHSQFLSMKNLIYSGEATVKDGKFTFSFIVPKDISYNIGFGRISYYAQAEKNDANGAYDSLLIGGNSDTFEIDNIGPEIVLFLNDSTFQNGDFTLEDPTLVAYLTDEHGINALGSSIGHDIVAYIDDDVNHPYVLNSYYKSNRDDFTSGRLEFRFQNLSDGPHTLKLKAWDVYNNSSEAEINFNVSRDAPLDIQNVKNFPNPFQTNTKFQFDHQHFNKDLKLNIRIMTVDGIVVDEIGPAIVTANGYSTIPLEWDGLNSKGARVAAGIYIYQIIVEGENGSKEQKSGKLVLLN